MSRKTFIIVAAVAALSSIITTILVATLLPPSGVVAAPRQLVGSPTVVTYQGYLTDAGGAPLDGQPDLHFRIYTTETGDTMVWEETHTDVTVTDGYFSVLLGSVELPLSASVFSGTERWMQVGVNTGSGYTNLPRHRIAAVPYALQAQEAVSVPWSGVTEKPSVGFTVVQASNYLDLSTTWTDVPGLATTFTPSKAESAHILVFGAFNHQAGTAPAQVGDQQEFRLVVDGTPVQEMGCTATGDVGVLTRTLAQKVDLTAGSSHTIKIQARNATGNRSRFTMDGQMIYWRVPE
jgi:hypothetical protein